MTAQLFSQHPEQGARSGGNKGVDHRKASRAVCFQFGTSVKAEPTNPEQSGTDHGQRQTVGSHWFFWIALAVTEDESSDQSRYTGIDVHHSTTGKVESAHFKEQSAAGPDHMGDREIDDRQPDRAEHHDRREFHPLDNRPEHER